MKFSWLLLIGLALSSVINSHAQNQNTVGQQIEQICIFGNEKTKVKTILRELPFSQGEYINTADTNKLSKISIQNLTNTQLFNYVEVRFTAQDSTLIVSVRLEERWYLIPNFIASLAETNFNTWWQNKDFSRINAGFSFQWKNFSGRKDQLIFLTQAGWTHRIGVNYDYPNLGKKQKFGGGILFEYSNNREINYASKNGLRLFFKNNSFIQEVWQAKSKIEYRPQLFNLHKISLNYQYVSIADTVQYYTKAYLSENQNQNNLLQISYGFRREKRDNKSYPLHGHLIDFNIDQSIFAYNIKNGIKLGTINFTTNLHGQIQNRWYGALGVKSKITYSGTPPYFFQRGLGYSNQYIRGYELFVIDGQHYGLLKSNIKYNLVKKKTIDFNFKKLNKFTHAHYALFLNAFADAGYVIDKLNADQNPYANDLQYGFGFSLDFVSYYDTVIRFEGSINKKGQPGFYIHFANPI